MEVLPVVTAGARTRIWKSQEEDLRIPNDDDVEPHEPGCMLLSTTINTLQRITTKDKLICEVGCLVCFGRCNYAFLGDMI